MTIIYFIQKEGYNRLLIRETQMNIISSFTHIILTVKIEAITAHQKITSHHNFVEVASSEKTSRIGGSPQQVSEFTLLNCSMKTLENCFSALASERGTHIPYRNSVLTKILKDSLCGNARTLMIATLNPSNFFFNESLSTLQNAEKVRKL